MLYLQLDSVQDINGNESSKQADGSTLLHLAQDYFPIPKIQPVSTRNTCSDVYRLYLELPTPKYFGEERTMLQPGIKIFSDLLSVCLMYSFGCAFIFSTTWHQELSDRNKFSHWLAHILPHSAWISFAEAVSRNSNGMGACSAHAVESDILKCQALSEQLISTVP